MMYHNNSNNNIHNIDHMQHFNQQLRAACPPPPVMNGCQQRGFLQQQQHHNKQLLHRQGVQNLNLATSQPQPLLPSQLQMSSLLHHTASLLALNNANKSGVRPPVVVGQHAGNITSVPRGATGNNDSVAQQQLQANLLHQVNVNNQQRISQDMENNYSENAPGLVNAPSSVLSAQQPQQQRMMAMHPVHTNVNNMDALSSIGSRNVLQSGKKSPKPDSYKTVMCQAWLESKICNFGENCRFAHGEQELRPCKIQPKSNNKYKTKLCDKFTTTGLCPYGNRCLFIHPDDGDNAYIRADKVAEIAQKHADAEKRRLVHNGPETSMMPFNVDLPGVGALVHHDTPVRGTGLGARLGLRPHPSWPLEPANFFQKEMMLQDILADFVRSTSPIDQLMDTRRTPSPDMSELFGKDLDMNTPSSAVSGYFSGEASPAGSSLFGSQSPLQVVGGGGTSPFTSSALSLDGDAVDPVEEAFMSAPNEVIPNIEKKDGTSSAVTSPAVKSYDPFTFALGTDNLAREMCKHLDLW